jgi:hypothetical protein
MPREAINRVLMISRCQGMPDMITYANRRGCEIGDTVEDYPSNDDDNDESYQDSKQSEDESNTELDSGDDSLSGSDSDSSSSSNKDDDQEATKNPRSKLGMEAKAQITKCPDSCMCMYQCCHNNQSTGRKSSSGRWTRR